MMQRSSEPVPQRDARRTRQDLLTAAQKLFAEQGYTTTGVREIASVAGVNATLIRRYFGSKEGLLRAAVEDVLHVEIFTYGERCTFGKRAVAALLASDALPNPTAMMILATADPAARALCADLMHDRIVVPLAEWLGGLGAITRAARLNMLWIGYMTARNILPVRSLDDDAEATRLWVEGLTQAIADDDGKQHQVTRMRGADND